MEEEQILILIRSQGEKEKGYRALMNRYQEKLYQHIRRMVNNHEDSDDVLQNTFIKIFQNIEKFEGKSSLYTWIYRIATNEALSFIKKNRKKSWTHDSIQNQNGLENKLLANDGPDSGKLSWHLDKAITLLPEKQKSVFSLRYFEEMSYKQMSEVLETSEGALKASFHHAVKKIESYFNHITIY